MILSDRDIRARLAQGDLRISELADPALQIQPASIDLRLAPEFIVYKPAQIACLDPRDPQSLSAATERVVIPDGEGPTARDAAAATRTSPAPSRAGSAATRPERSVEARRAGVGEAGRIDDAEPAVARSPERPSRSRWMRRSVSRITRTMFDIITWAVRQRFGNTSCRFQRQ